MICCNFSLIKLVAGPFLNTAGNVQGAVERTADCVQNTRTRLSCTDFLSSANLTALPSIEEDLESGFPLKKFDDGNNKKIRKAGFFQTLWNYLTYFFSALTSVSCGKIVHWIGIILAVGMVLLFVYASFTV
jgi:hypothetical protein